jgi:tetratricopeptide (TPR) repeat protein
MKPLFILGFLLCLGCPPPRVAFNSPRFKGLPEEVPALIELADKLLKERPPSRERSDRALAALELAAEKNRRPSFDILWRQAWACFMMTEGESSKEQRLSDATRGREYAELALKENDKRVEGHLYWAFNMAKITEATGKVKNLKPMMDEAELAAKIDPKFDDAAALRFMGKVYITAPAWPVSVGSSEKAVEVLVRAIATAPVPLTRLFLGQAYFHDEQLPKAKEHLERALREGADVLDARWRKEGEEYLKRIADKQKK